MAESLTEHLKRRAAVLAERVELELSVAGTEFAPLERAVFKSTKNNTKIPKEKHVIALHRAIGDGDSCKTVLKMLARRLKEVAQERISSGSFAGGLKTLAVWHRCLNSGDNTFLQLCAQYIHVLEPPAQNPFALMYGTYLKELLQTFVKCKHAYHRETDYEESNVSKLSQGDLIAHVPPMLKQMTKLLECDLQGGLMDSKTRCSVQYVINLLVLDSIPLFKAIDMAMDRVRDCVGSLKPEDAERMAGMYGRYVKMPERLLNLLKQKTLRAFKAKLEEVQIKLRKEGCDYDTIKALAEVAVHRSREEQDDLPMKAVATFSLDEIEADQVARALFQTELVDLSSPTAAHGQDKAAWDPFSDLASQNRNAAQSSAAHSSNPFASPGVDPQWSAAPQTGGASLLLDMNQPTASAPPGVLSPSAVPVYQGHAPFSVVDNLWVMVAGTLTGEALQMLYAAPPGGSNTIGVQQGMQGFSASGAHTMGTGLQGFGVQAPGMQGFNGMGRGGAQTVSGGAQGFSGLGGAQGGSGMQGGAQTMGAGMLGLGGGGLNGAPSVGTAMQGLGGGGMGAAQTMSGGIQGFGAGVGQTMGNAAQGFGAGAQAMTSGMPGFGAQSVGAHPSGGGGMGGLGLQGFGAGGMGAQTMGGMGRGGAQMMGGGMQQGFGGGGAQTMGAGMHGFGGGAQTMGSGMQAAAGGGMGGAYTMGAGLQGLGGGAHTMGGNNALGPGAGKADTSEHAGKQPPATADPFADTNPFA